VRILDESLVLDRQQLYDITLNDPELMREVLSALLDDTSRQVLLMDAAIRRHDPEDMRRLAHSCKGACANVGANAAAGVLRRLEQQAVEGQIAACASTIAALSIELARLQSELEGSTS
jgi:HPt (histidine-containing phosphotransfer) domain-containing protein